MPISIKLDAHAVRALINDDETFKLDMQQAVLSEVIRGSFQNQLPSAMTAMIEKTFPAEREKLVKAITDDENLKASIRVQLGKLTQSVRSGSLGSRLTFELSEDVRKLIAERMNELLTLKIKESMEVFELNLNEKFIQVKEAAEARVESKLTFLEDTYRREVITQVRKQVSDDLLRLSTGG